MRLAEIERRSEQQQAAWIIRTELERRGLLPASQPTGPQAAAPEMAGRQ